MERAEAIRPFLKRGSEGIFVNNLQSVLKMLGYYKGNITGKFDLATEHAVKSFQADRALVIDGIVGPVTWAALDEAMEQALTEPGTLEKIFSFIRNHPLLVGSIALVTFLGGLYLLASKEKK